MTGWQPRVRRLKSLLRGLPLLIVLGLVATGLVGGVGLVLSTFQAERAQRLQADQANRLIVLLRDISRDAVDAETAQRGYLIALNGRYLAPWRRAREQIDSRLDNLRTLAIATGDHRQLLLAADVERLVRAKFAEVEDTIRQIEGGDIFGAQKRVVTNEGQEVMERLRLATARMERNERERLAMAQARADDSGRVIVPLLGGLLAMILLALLLGLWLIMRNADAEARASHAAEVAAARDRADLLAHELNHRVKNLFAVVLAIVQMSARDSVEARPVATTIADRIRALLKSHEVTQGAAGHGKASLEALVDTVLAPYCPDRQACTVEGPPVALPSGHATPIGLILHELVTNAVKYGALADDDGRLAIRWSVIAGQPQRLEFDWREHCARGIADPGGQEGFGSYLLQGSIRQIGGEFSRRFHADGHEIVLRFPLPAEG